MSHNHPDDSRTHDQFREAMRALARHGVRFDIIHRGDGVACASCPDHPPLAA